MEYDCHVFKVASISNEKSSISIEISSILIKNLDFNQNTRYFESELSKYFFLHLEFEILDISSETPSISKMVWSSGLFVDFMHVL